MFKHITFNTDKLYDMSDELLLSFINHSWQFKQLKICVCWDDMTTPPDRSNFKIEKLIKEQLSKNNSNKIYLQKLDIKSDYDALLSDVDWLYKIMPIKHISELSLNWGETDPLPVDTIKQFYNLKVLKLESVEISVHAFQCLLNLQELHITECCITDISNATECHAFINKPQSNKNSLKYFRMPIMCEVFDRLPFPYDSDTDSDKEG